MTDALQKLRVVIAGGGTGGHLFPALNIAEGIKQKWQSEFLFFGSDRGLESKKVPELGYQLKIIPVAGFHRRLTIKNLTFPFKLLKSMQICRQTLKEFNPHLVVGSGGYVMGPVLKSAAALGIVVTVRGRAHGHDPDHTKGASTMKVAPKIVSGRVVNISMPSFKSAI